MANNTILVTGSSGTVGTAVVERLSAEGYCVLGVDERPPRWNPSFANRTMIADLREEAELAKLPTGVDMIIHLAANARVHRLVQNPEFARDNILSTFNVLEFARENDVPRVVFASSREVYGNSDQVVYDETESRTENCESPYTASKVSGEALVTAYRECYGLETCIVRLSNVYGRYDASNRVMPLFIARSSYGRELVVYGAQKLLDFTYLDDCVDGLVRIVDQFPKAREMTLNIASGRGNSLIDLAETVNELTPDDSEIVVEPSRTGEVDRYVADTSKAERVLGYTPQYTLADGLRETVAWYLDHPSVLEEIVGGSMRTTND